jgi:hypothetical protein
MLSLHYFGVQSTELDTPEANAFPADSDASFGEKVFDISVAQIEAIVEPDSVADDIWRESVTFVGVHPPILADISNLTCQYP